MGYYLNRFIVLFSLLISITAVAGTYENAQEAARQQSLAIHIGSLLQRFGDPTTFNSKRFPEKFDHSRCESTGCLGTEGIYYFYENETYSCKITLGRGYYYVTSYNISTVNCCTKTAPATCHGG